MEAVLRDGGEVLLRERDVGDRQVVGGERDRHAAAMQQGERVLGARCDDACLHVRGGAEVQRHATPDQLRAEVQVVNGTRAVRDPLRSQGQPSANLPRAAPFASVQGDPQACGRGGLERRAVVQRVGEGLLRPGEVEAAQALGPEVGRGQREPHVVGRGMRPHGRGDQADLEPGLAGRPARPAADGGDPVGQRQPARRVEQRPPADLDVADAVRGLRLHQLRRDLLECLGVLEQRDRQVERAEQFLLRGADRRRGQRLVHPTVGRRRRYAPRPRQGQGRVHPDRAVQVEVQLGLGHGLDQAAQRRRAESGRRPRAGRLRGRLAGSTSGVWRSVHGPMLPSAQWPAATCPSHDTRAPCQRFS